MVMASQKRTSVTRTENHVTVDVAKIIRSVLLFVAFCILVLYKSPASLPVEVVGPLSKILSTF